MLYYWNDIVSEYINKYKLGEIEMPKGSPELISARKKEIVKACETLYQTRSFREINLKEIGKVTSFTRTSIYNYFQTKEEIFLELLKKEYELWIEEIQQIMEHHDTLLKQEFADYIAKSLEHRKQLLKIMSMNMYDMEENSRMENLVNFKKVYGKSLEIMLRCVGKFFPDMTAEEKQSFIYKFFPFIYGVYPYTMVTDKQKKAIEQAGVNYEYYTVYEITYQCLMQLLP